jgi:hypothetical protein
MILLRAVNLYQNFTFANFPLPSRGASAFAEAASPDKSAGKVQIIQIDQN